MNLADTLLSQPPFATAQPGAGFVEALAANLTVLRQRFPRYAQFLDTRTQPAFALPTNLEEVQRLPAVFLPVLKSYPFALPDDVVTPIRLTSSGTTGRPSVTPQDETSWNWRVQAMRAAYVGMDLLGSEVNALAFLMDPATTQMAGSLVIDAVLRSVPQVRSITYLARMGSSGPDFALPTAVNALMAALPHGPVLLIGYPALIAAVMQGMMQQGKLSLPLPPGSLILTGGGWKSFLPGVSLHQDEFRAGAAAFFGLPATSIRDMYGLSECPAVFVQCEHGHYHVPTWAWAQAIDPETNAEVPAGSEGLLQLTVPLTTSYPLAKILTTDKVTLEHACACGRAAPFLTPRGRVTAARFETCAMKMSKAVA